MFSPCRPTLTERKGTRMEFERLKNKVIVVSGGTKGVGRAFAEVAGREGAMVVIGWQRSG